MLSLADIGHGAHTPRGSREWSNVGRALMAQWFAATLDGDPVHFDPQCARRHARFGGTITAGFSNRAPAALDRPLAGARGFTALDGYMTARSDIAAAPVLARISDYVAMYARETPDREAVVSGDVRISYATLDERVGQCARALLAAGVNKGDRVAMLAVPSAEFLVVFLATVRIGAIWVGLNARYRIEELRRVIGDCRPKVLFVISNFEAHDFRGDIELLMREYDCVQRLVCIDTGSVAGAEDLPRFLQGAQGVSKEDYAAVTDAVDRMDAALIVYTSGSSGRSKGAMLSHYALCSGNAIQGREFGVHLPRAICPFPINHVACVGDVCCTTLIRGGTIVFMTRFDPKRILEVIERERINLWVGVPTMFILAAAEPEFATRDLSSVDTIVWGGAALPREQILRLQRLGVRLMTLYGLTEATTDLTFTAPDSDIEELAETVGRPPPEYPCRIVTESGVECAVGEAGEIQFKGEFNMLGYLNDPQATHGAFTDDGWLRTGDICYRRGDGNIVLVGRKSDMFKSGGFNVYPREIEQILEQHAAVAMAAVIGVPDRLYQEVGEAHVVLNPGHNITSRELREFCRQRLADYKIPKRFIVQAALPMLPVGKVDKAGLRHQVCSDEQASHD
jgi:fatty-acyl-CoA synthase